MKRTIFLPVIIVIMTLIFNTPSFPQRWERVGEDNTPGDSRVPLCILEKDGYIFFGDDHTGVYRLKPDSDTSNWVHLVIPGMNVVYDLVVFDGLLWCTSDGNGVFSSDDNGETWLDKNAGLTHLKVYALTVCNNVLFCGTYHGGVFRYDNGSGTWAAVNNGFQYEPKWWYALELQTIDNAVILFGVGIGIYKTTDLGETWNPLNNIQYEPNAEATDFVKHGSYLMIPADYLGAMRSMNNGTTWEFCNNGITSQMDAVSMAATEDAVFVGTSDSGIFISTDRGDHWKMANLGFPIDWQTQRYANPASMAVIGNQLYVGTWFYGVWSAPMDALIAGKLSVPDNLQEENIILGQNQPNPFSASTEIRYKITSGGFISLKIYDLVGKEVATLVNEIKSPGEYSTLFIPANCPAPISGGIYFYTLQQGTSHMTRKMIFVN